VQLRPKPWGEAAGAVCHIVAFGAVLTPIGLIRKNPDAAQRRRRGERPWPRPVYTDPPMKSGGVFALGVSLVVLGVAVVASRRSWS